MGILLVVGTIKGAFLARSDDERQAWQIEGPLFKGWKVTTSARDASGRMLLATASDVYGPAIQVSQDLSEWKQIEDGPAWPMVEGEEKPRKLNQIWTIVPPRNGEGTYYAGVDEAGLFQSEDGGQTWRSVEGLNEHPTRTGWFPGAGGMCAHAVLVDPNDPQRVWCGISAVGVFRTDDGGATWTSKNSGVPRVIEDKTHDTIGFCVHALAQDPDSPDTIYRQDHRGMYRTRDGGESWEQIETGLPSKFGFPIALDQGTRSLYAIPLESDEYRMPVGGRLTVYRSQDAGASWQPLTNGLPQEHAYMGVLRGALDVDHLDPCGVYFGSTAGTVHLSADGGESWQTLPCTLPRVLNLKAYQV